MVVSIYSFILQSHLKREVGCSRHCNPSVNRRSYFRDNGIDTLSYSHYGWSNPITFLISSIVLTNLLKDRVEFGSYLQSTVVIKIIC